MLTIQITTLSGAVERREVQQVEFIVKCHHSKCGLEFHTIDPDQFYCKPSHKVRASEFRRILQELGAVISKQRP